MPRGRPKKGTPKCPRLENGKVLTVQICEDYVRRFRFTALNPLQRMMFEFLIAKAKVGTKP